LAEWNVPYHGFPHGVLAKGVAESFDGAVLEAKRAIELHVAAGRLQPGTYRVRIDGRAYATHVDGPSEQERRAAQIENAAVLLGRWENALAVIRDMTDPGQIATGAPRSLLMEIHRIAKTSLGQPVIEPTAVPPPAAAQAAGLST